MNKKAVILALFFTGFYIAAAETQLIKRDGTQLEIPEDWKVIHKDGANLYSIYSPGFAIMIDLVKEELEKPLTFNEYYDMSLDGLKKTFNNLEVLEKKDDYHIFRASLAGIELINLQAYFIKDKTAYILSIGASKEDFAKYRPVILKVKNSFQFTDDED